VSKIEELARELALLSGEIRQSPDQATRVSLLRKMRALLAEADHLGEGQADLKAQIAKVSSGA
jgi:hypothetical protein